MSGNTSNAVHSVPQSLGDCAEMGERFNFAQHIFTINAGRAEKLAVRCDYGQLTYGA